MQIRVFGAAAAGPTPLAAFDRALQQGNVEDTNLLVLSSIVPVDAVVTRGVASPGEFTVGDRLYVVMAEERVIEPGAEAWAGLGWVVDPDGRGGLFVEAHGRSEHQVRFDLEQTLDALVADRPALHGAPRDLELAGISCEVHPVCALVLAIFESAEWSG
jgi:arginine decarboxylase